MIARPTRRLGPIPFANAAMPPSLTTQWRAHDQDAPWMQSQAPEPSDGGGQPRSTILLEHAPAPRGRELRATFHGHGVLSVRSLASGALYRFQGHGASLVIDPRDALLLGRLSDVHVG